jgi:hypothetical protein
MDFKNNVFGRKPILMCSKMKELFEMPREDALALMKDRGDRVVFNDRQKR